MVRRSAAGGGWKVRASLASLAVVAAGCVTTYEDVGPSQTGYSTNGAGAVTKAYSAEIAVPVAIPIADLGDGDRRILVEFYNGILRRLQEAAEDGDIALLDSLVASYDRPDLPAAIARHLDGYRAVGRGLAFEQHLRRNARLELRSEQVHPLRGQPRSEADRRSSAGRSDTDAAAEPTEPPLGQPLALELCIPAMVEPVELGGKGESDRIGFAVSVRIEDEFVDGRTQSAKTSDYLWLPETVRLAGDAVLRLPIDVDSDAADAVRRRVFVRIDLLGGFVRCGDVRAPVRRRATIAAGTWTQVPAGYDKLRAAPLRALRIALRDFRPHNYASAWLAAQLVPPAERPEAYALLIDQVRFGRPDQATVAMAALARIADVGIAVGDRDAWLEWYEARR